MRTRIFGLTLTLMLCATMLFAQTATPTSKLNWDEVSQSVATATGAAYNSYSDASATGVLVTGLTCVAGVPIPTANCTASFPALAPGPHTMTLTQLIGTAESAKSNSISFTFVVVVTPTNFKIVRLLNPFASGGVFTSRGRQRATQKVTIRDFRRLPG